MQSPMRFIQSTLYRLKRQFGAEATLYRTESSSFDPMLGQKSTVRTFLKIRKAIVLPDSLANKFAYQHSYSTVNRKFVYGAQWDQSQRMVVIDGDDLPKNHIIKIEDCLVFNNQRYAIIKAERFDIGYGYLLTVIRSENNLPLQILELDLAHEVVLGQSTGIQ